MSIRQSTMRLREGQEDWPEDLQSSRAIELLQRERHRASGGPPALGIRE